MLGWIYNVLKLMLLLVLPATRLNCRKRNLVRRIPLLGANILCDKSLHFITTFVRRVNPTGKLRRIAVLPFILLIRGAVYFHSQNAWYPTVSLIASGAITTLLLFIYLTFMYGRMTGKIGSGNALKQRSIFALLLVLGYSIYGLFFLSNTNAKSSEVHSEFTNLHPIVRLSISTILFIDRDLIITDAKRQPEDYKKNGFEDQKTFAALQTK